MASSARRPLAAAGAAGLLVAALSAPAATPTAAHATTTTLAQAPAADSFPHDPSDDTPAAEWANPSARSTDPQQSVALDVRRIDPTLATTSTPSIRYTLRITNNRIEPISSLSLRLFAADPVTTGPSIRLAQLANQGEFPRSSNLLTLPGSLAPGESRDVTVSVPIASSSSDATTLTLPKPGLDTPGAHPLLFSLSGAAHQEGSTQLLGVARATLSVVASEDKDVPTPVTVLYPLAAETNTTAGATGDAPQRPELYLSNEDLTEQLRAGGRLRGLLDAYRGATKGTAGEELRAATCLAIDPELVDTVDRMAGGYAVGSKIPDTVGEPKRLRDSWSDLLGRNRSESVPGQGAEVARAWLDDLRDVVENNCSVPLPYAGADLETLARVDSEWLSATALEDGAETLERVLGQVPMKDVLVPGGGYLSAGAVGMLETSPGGDGGAGAARSAGGAERSGMTTALVAENTVQVDKTADADTNTDGSNASTDGNEPADLSQLAPGVRALTYSADLGAALMATGSEPQVAPYSNPELRYSFSSDSPTARMSTAVALVNQQIAAGDPVVAVPPAQWTVSRADAEAFLGSVSAHLADDSATARPLSAAVSASEDAALPAAEPTPTFADVAEPSEEFIGAVRRAATNVRNLTLLMRNDPAIAITREGYTRPLFRDVLRATSSYRARVRSLFTPSRRAAIERLVRVEDTVSDLRESIALLPPGNVFTRTSDASPLLVVARNGLPLPVPAKVDYYSDATTPVTVSLPEDVQLIPAKGSITLSLTTDVEDRSETTNLSLWLAAPPGSAEARALAGGVVEAGGAGSDPLDNRRADEDPTRISEPVELRVQSVPGMSGLAVGAIVAGLALIAVAGKVLWSRRSGIRPARIRR